MTDPSPFNRQPDDDRVGDQCSPKPFAPDIAKCHAKHAGFGDYVECLENGAVYCPFALHYGNSSFCRHPESAVIVARTGTGMT